ncbi:MAG: hypothetical protein R3B98_07080 [Hyphomonas sp.]
MSWLLIPPAFLAAFAGIWVTVLFLLGRISGWSRLHAAYPHDGGPIPVHRSMQSASIGSSPLFRVRYRNVLTVGTDGVFLFLKPGFLFGIMQPALAIPLSEIRTEQKQGLLGQLIHLRTAREPDIAIIIHERLFRWLQENGAELPATST